MKAVYYMDRLLCKEDENPGDDWDRYERIVRRSYHGDVNAYLSDNLSPLDMAGYSEEDMYEAYDQAIWDEEVSGFSVREIFDGGECECVDRSTEKPKPSTPGKFTIYYPTKNGTVGMEMTEITGYHMDKGCPICDARLKVIGGLERMGRMPDLYSCICEGEGHRLCFAEDEGYKLVKDE